MKEICNIFKKEMKLLNVNLYFLYEGNEINEELSLIQQINESEIENNTVNIFAFERDNIISIIYRINKDDIKIKLFGKTFVKNNKNNCYIFYVNEKYELTEYIGLENYKCDMLEIKLVGIKKVKNMRGLFEKCSSLYSLPDIAEWNTENVIDMSRLFYGCSSLYYSYEKSKNDIYNAFNEMDEILEILYPNDNDIKNNINEPLDNYPYIKDRNNNIIKNNILSKSNNKSFYNISNWNTKNVLDISFIFLGCEYLKLLPDISKWNIEKVKNISGMFACCKLLEVIPDISKWDIKNITDISFLFCGCSSLKNIIICFHIVYL